MAYVVVGASAAGINAAKTLREINKDTNVTKKSNNIMNKTNRTRLKIYLPSITKLNKDIKYQTEKAKLNRKKNIIPLKSKALAYVSDYNYGVVFKNQNISPQTYV